MNRFIFGSIIVLILAFIIPVVIVLYRRREVQEDVLLVMSIMAFEADETYYFILKNDRTFISSFGRRRHFLYPIHINRRNFMRSIEASAEIVLGKQDFQNISEMLEALIDDTTPTLTLDELISVSGGWRVTLLYDGNVIDAFFWDLPTELFKNLVHMVIQLSPLRVSMHGWAPVFDD